jgi:hypothetical protein
MSKTARNPITNDLIKSKTGTDSFDKNFDQIDWSVKLEPKIESALEYSIKDNDELYKKLKD